MPQIRPDLFIRLSSDAHRNGQLIGRLAGPVLRRRVAMTRRLQKAQKIPDALIAARIRDFTRHVRRFAPHWLDETGGLASGAGVRPADILMLNCLPPGFYPAQKTGLHCTSFIAIGPDENLLLKIRDERNHVQTFFTTFTRGGVPIQVGHDIGNLGVAHCLNGYGLGGANNSGSHTRFVPDDPRLNDCHILRYFAENAARVEDVPRLFERLIAARAAGGAGPGRGAIYLFADRNRGLLLETHSTDYVATFFDKGLHVVSNHFLTARAQRWMSRQPNLNTRRRKERMEALLARASRPPAPREIFAITRDRRHRPHCLCNDDQAHFWMTLSAQLHVIDRRAPERSINYMCCGNTRHSVYVPVPLACRQSYAPLLSGRFYQQADRLYRRGGGGNSFRQRQAAFEKEAPARDDARERLIKAYALMRAMGTRPPG